MHGNELHIYLIDMFASYKPKDKSSTSPPFNVDVKRKIFVIKCDGQVIFHLSSDSVDFSSD